jgi:coproporphyrinogen III oxidase-like Fe-S oxidoreductase
VANPKDIGLFLQGHERLWGMQIELVDPEDFLMETLMMGLRLDDGIPSALLERRFGSAFEKLFPGLWESWIARGLAQQPGESLSLTGTGRMFLDGLLTEASRARESSDPRPLEVMWP